MRLHPWSTVVIHGQPRILHEFAKSVFSARSSPWYHAERVFCAFVSLVNRVLSRCHAIFYLGDLIANHILGQPCNLGGAAQSMFFTR